MKAFIPCRGKTACRDDGERCLTCGRDFTEIERLRVHIDGLVELALDMGYENIEAFAAYAASKIEKKVRHRRAGGGATD